MFLSKFTASTLLFSSTSFAISKKYNKQAFAEEKSAAEKSAQDLDAIFAQGGVPPDPEELQEMILKA